MKKNITINLCGRLFNIDEDAYELLKKYLDTLHNYFNKQKSGDEIADDIEQRIAELLDELKAQGVEAINIEHVKEVIGRMGQPEEMASEETESTANAENDYHSENLQGDERPNWIDKVKDLFKDKRFYRNPKDKMLAGVISGLASSFEVDVTLLRLGVVLLVVALGALPFPFIGYWHFRSFMFFIFTYLVLAAIMPAAETPEEQLKMQGKPVNINNLANEVVQNVSENVDKMRNNSGTKSVINGIMKVLTGCLKALLIVLGVALFFTGIGILVLAIICIFSPINSPQFFKWDMAYILNDNLNLFIIFLGTLLASIFIPAYAIFYSLNHRMGIAQRIIWILIWVSAFATALVTGALIDQKDDHIKWKEFASRNEKNVKDLSEEDMEYLDMCGWKVTKRKNCDRITAYGQHYSGDEQMRYLDDYDDECRQRLTVKQSKDVQPGWYKLTAVVRSSGLGPVLWAKVNDKRYQTEFPITGNEGGDLWKEASQNLSLNQLKEEFGDEADNHWKEMKAINNANHGKGFGWCSIAIDSIWISEPTSITYGISTDPRTTGIPMHAQWFSACDVELWQI